jgi:hypothetical protein
MIDCPSVFMLSEVINPASCNSFWGDRVNLQPDRVTVAEGGIEAGFGHTDWRKSQVHFMARLLRYRLTLFFPQAWFPQSYYPHQHIDRHLCAIGGILQ